MFEDLLGKEKIEEEHLCTPESTKCAEQDQSCDCAPEDCLCRDGKCEGCK